jgi:alpha-glucoside transport system permease protein
MRDLFLAIVTVVVGIGGLLAVLGLLYAAVKFLPRQWREGARAWVFVVPALICMFVGLLVPALRTLYVSMFNFSGQKFVGLDNYKSIFTQNGTRLAVVNSLTWVVVGTLGSVILGLTIARFADGMRGEKIAKSAVFIPLAISLVGAAVIWKFVYADNSQLGLLNQVTKVIPGLPDSLGGNGKRNWVLKPDLGGLKPPSFRGWRAPGFNTFLLIIIFIWAQTGFATVIFSAAIKGVPDSLIEAAKVDGATTRQAFYKVTLPYIRATIVTIATTITIAGLKVFDIVAATTGGNFGTDTIANQFDLVKFVQGDDGLASALGVLIFILVIPVVVINRRTQRRAEELMGA